MKHAFISYCQDTDQDFVENLITRLDIAGFTTWYDQKIKVGEEWRTAIDTAIKDSFAFIVVMTPEASIAPYITYEWAYAKGKNIKIIPILLRETKLHKRLGALQYLDFTSRDRPWSKLIEEIKSAQDAAIAQNIQNILSTSLSSLFSLLRSTLSNQVIQEEEEKISNQMTNNQHLILQKNNLESISYSSDIENLSIFSYSTIKDNPIVAALIDIQNNENNDTKTRSIASLTLEIIKNHIAIANLSDI